MLYATKYQTEYRLIIAAQQHQCLRKFSDFKVTDVPQTPQKASKLS